MKIKRLMLPGVFAAALLGALVLHAAKPADFGTAEIKGIWRQLWKSDDPAVSAPKLEKLSEEQARQRLMGKWTVMFGVIPDPLTITLRTNRLVEVSGRKDDKDWQKHGEWRVVADKLVLFLDEDDIPSFIFRTGGHDYIFDPWSKTLMSELKREK